MKQKPSKQKARKRYLILSSKGWGTGCALRAFYIAEALRRKGHTVHFPSPLPTLPGWIDMGLSTFYYFIYSLFVWSDVAFCVKPYPMAVPALWIQRRKGARVVFDVDDVDYAYSHGLFLKFHQWLQKPWPNWADLATYHNPLLKEHLLKDFKVRASRIRRLPQGVDETIFNTLPLKTQELPPGVEYWKSKSKGPVLCFTAHLNVACDLGPTMEAFRLLLNASPSVRLLVAGGGPDEDKFMDQARELKISSSVFFTGYLSPQEVAACLKFSDAVLVYYSDNPANRHRSSMKLRESLACGLKVVATNIGEAAVWKKGLYLSQADPTIYAKTIREALRSKKPPQQAALLVKKWGWQNCVTALEEEIPGS